MPDDFSIQMCALHSENLSPRAEEGSWARDQVDARIAYDHAGYEMSRLESMAKSLHIKASISEEREDRSGGSHFGGGPVIDYSTLLHITGALTAAAAFLKAARPILVELIKTRRTSFEFKHGDFTAKGESPASLDEIEAYIKRLADHVKESSGQDQESGAGELPPGGDQPFSE